MTRITKAVFPVAGFGSRFLPATKAQPKEMLPVVDKPLIQYAVEEAVSAGINELIFITGRNKRAIEDHFDKAYELETELEAAGKDKLLEHIRDILPKHVNCIYIRQVNPLGLGHAVLCARPVVGNEPFAVLLADDFMAVEENCPTVLQQMVELYEKESKSILAVQNVERQHTRQYGIVDATPYRDGLEFINAIVEKPSPETAPSTLAVVGRYILNPTVFRYLEVEEKGMGGEIQLTDAIAKLVATEDVCAYHFKGQRFDCGSKIGYLKATVTMGMKHPEVREEFRRFIADTQLLEQK